MPAPYSAADRVRIVEAFNNRGERSAKEIAAEFGIHPSVLYYFAKRAADGESLEPGRRSKPKPKPKPKARIKARAPTAEVVAEPPAKAIVVRQSGALSTSERDELVHLRAEVQRLRAMLRVAVEGR